ncbi:MAG: hypothetical protein Q9222_004203 [Ikaeria aurantiellina]
MGESTFLSRSFGDQGVRLRIRKEARTLLKRAASKPEDYGPVYDDPPPSLQRNVSALSHRQPLDTSYVSEYTGTGEPSAKRQRLSTDMVERNVILPDRYTQQPFPQLGTYATRDQPSFNFTGTYNENARAPYNTYQEPFNFTAGYSLPPVKGLTPAYPQSPRCDLPLARLAEPQHRYNGYSQGELEQQRPPRPPIDESSVDRQTLLPIEPFV